ncbi:dTMP kinase [Candidatus Phytoplasma ziziphi]|uniref:Thymidylate kinase n=4 Tax=Candidatus Phytoplasma TaxID=33926 RepID=A0A660HMF0_ZIZJU|nr:dTMP kinase [Candidatus Phytoplasma ziziphi]ACZ95827.1 thymidylate kinase [Jujube witches'-broom phytoplasma]AJA72441.1 thymidylate kinase [Paulownia witches'-broom phytoplasma]AJA72442.1 thymidylate kinase [Paulownia witches'-broom phytoplasma]AJA72453.1 thymidylate kinase [Paulownia witches'-broom phytoplasma]AJA72469.1 thymidylate kinase [Paulownia witches'-broom phytoplasma]
MKLIVFEGLDGSGKTSLIHALQPQLKTPHQLYQGLGSSSLGKEIRDLFLNFQQVDYITRFYLSLANMSQIQAELIVPQLKNNQLIILDRWLPSTYAYQLFPFSKEKKQLLPLKKIFKINHETILKKPDLLIYLDIDPLIGRTRKKNQKNHQRDLIERQSLTYFQNVRQGYDHYITHYTSGVNKLILNGSDSIKSNVKQIIKQIGVLSNGDHN